VLGSYTSAKFSDVPAMHLPPMKYVSSRTLEPALVRWDPGMARRGREAEDPWRDRSQDESSRYAEAVHDWRRRRADVCKQLIRDELAPGERGAFLVWGDPSLYDSTLAILEDIKARGEVTFDHEVIPGISSVSALAARHRINLNRVGRPIHITPGRRLPGSLQNDDGDVVVMLDAHESFQHFAGDGIWIYWGAYLGTPDEILISGPLDEVSDRIRQVRAEARAEHGWIMDTYLLRLQQDTMDS
ncbi:precorrin-6A synthase (deacetylating), partial [Streptomyces sp. NPDC056831]|uniref:precorrin-6A synthase (deacetylating) n=1 Tax=Streptomyces sp. NPDC056831 TaxID=3345954 RepID=UPI0036D1815F